MNVSKTTSGVHFFNITDSSLKTEPSISLEEQCKRLEELSGESMSRRYFVIFEDGVKYKDTVTGKSSFNIIKAKEIEERFKHIGIECSLTEDESVIIRKRNTNHGNKRV